MWSRDFKEFVGLLNRHGVEYLLIGGYALGIHGYPRYTGDLDIWVRPAAENARKLVAVMADFGLESLGLRETDFAESGNVIQLGQPPFRIDLITQPDGVDFEECFQRRIVVEYDGVTLPVIGLEDFKRNKQASGRPKDLFDLASLQ
jgi:hypothetical protein